MQDSILKSITENHPFVADIRENTNVKLANETSHSQDGFNSKFQSFLNIMKELNTVIFLMQLMV